MSEFKLEKKVSIGTLLLLTLAFGGWLITWGSLQAKVVGLEKDIAVKADKEIVVLQYRFMTEALKDLQTEVNELRKTILDQARVDISLADGL